MTSPLIEAARDIPLNPKHILLNEDEESGFPFDDQEFDRGRSHQSSFRSQLDDLAKRHPEFAQHLNIGDDFPFRSHTLGRHRRGSDTEKPSASGSQDAEFGRRHAYDRSFPRFEHFESPFRRYFEEDVPDFYEVPHQVRHTYGDDLPEEPHHQTQSQQQHQQKSQPSSPQPTTAEKPPQVPQHRESGRKQNIQQSNTVDLGQKQQPVDENRGQRSMSAPPENRSTGQRFVTSINIPIQRTGGVTGGGDMGNKASAQEQPNQHQQSNKPNERVIPIHVEGRDEPIIPKNTTFTQSTPQPQQERVFGRNPGHFTQFLNKGEPHGMNPEDYYRQQQQQFQKQQEFQPQQSQTQPSTAASSSSSPSQTAPQSEPARPQTPPPPQQSIKLTQLDQIQNIQKDVSELMNQVEVFNGKPKDKQYLYLDEMLTRNLIKLDNIETEGKDNIRQARKEAIKCIEGCIGILEAKANANLAMETQRKRESAEQKMEVTPNAEADKKESEEQVENVPSATTLNEDSEASIAPKEEVVKDVSQSTSLEVSGISRTGSVANVTPMEVNVDESKKEVPESKTPSETKTIDNAEETSLSTNTQKSEENKEVEIVKQEENVKKDDDMTKQVEEAVLEKNEENASTTENASRKSIEESTSQASEKDKTEKKKGKKKEKSDKK